MVHRRPVRSSSPATRTASAVESPATNRRTTSLLIGAFSTRPRTRSLLDNCNSPWRCPSPLEPPRTEPNGYPCAQRALTNKAEQDLWLGAEVAGQRRDVREDDIEVLRGRGLVHLVRGGPLRLTGHPVGRAKSSFTSCRGNAPMATLIAPPHT